MFNLLAVGDTSDEPIQTLLPTKELFTFLLVVQDKEAIWDLWLGEKLALLELAARFECEVITINVNRLLEYHYAKSTAIDLLIEASNLNSVSTAKIAIAKMEIEYQADRISWFPDWETWMKHLLPAWQTELKRLLWKTHQRIVERPNEPRKRKRNGRLLPQERETIIVRTKKSYKEVAAAFNPASEVSHGSVRSSCSGQVGGGLAKSYVYSIYAPFASTFPYSNAIIPDRSSRFVPPFSALYNTLCSFLYPPADALTSHVLYHSSLSLYSSVHACLCERLLIEPSREHGKSIGSLIIGYHVAYLSASSLSTSGTYQHQRS